MVDESFETLQTELANLLRLISDARERGNDALAEFLTADAAQCLIRLADLHTPVAPIERPGAAMQQQQQIQPDDPEDKE